MNRGDVFGTVLDLNSKIFEVTYNGRELHSASSAFSGPDDDVGHGFYPFLSGKQVKVQFNVGGEDFRYGPKGIQSIVSTSIRPLMSFDPLESSIFQVKIYAD